MAERPIQGRYGTVCYGIVRYGTVWYGIVRNDMARSVRLAASAKHEGGGTGSAFGVSAASPHDKM